MTTLIRTALIAAAFGALPAAAQEAGDCAAPAGEIASLVCADPSLRTLDGTVAEHLAAAREKGDAAAIDAGQQAWREETLAPCASAADPSACLETAYTRRNAELVALYDLATPIAATKWHCGGSPLETLTAVFFETDPATVRLERAGDVEVAYQTLSGSGARYETPAGLVFWTKGNEAMIQQDGVPEVDCVLG